MRDAKLILEDILRAMEAIESFVAGMDFAAFDRDLKTKSAVLAQLATMGEAVKLLPDDIRAANPAIMWRSMAGMRDRLIHGYFKVDYALVWRTVTEVLPADIRAVREMIAGLAKPNS